MKNVNRQSRNFTASNQMTAAQAQRGNQLAFGISPDRA